MKKMLILSLAILLLESSLFASGAKMYRGSVNNLSKQDIDKKIAETFMAGIETLVEIAPSLAEQAKKNETSVYSECNDSLYYSIFTGTIVLKLHVTSSKLIFLQNCKRIFIKKGY